MNFTQIIDKLSASQQEADKGVEELDKELENILNHPAPPYYEKSYWDERYTRDPTPYEWYQPFSRIKPLIEQYLTSEASAVSVGCGNSSLNAEILECGLNKVVGIDVSDVVIKQMQQLYADESRLEWIIADCTAIPLPDASFDFVFDKGTLDSLNSSLQTVPQATQMLTEICRILKPGGLFFEVTYGTPNTRVPLITTASSQWELIETKEIEKPVDPGTFHYLYIFKKSG